MPTTKPSQPMDLASIRQLIDTLIEKQVDEFELEEEGRRIRIKRGGVVVAAAPVAVATLPRPVAAAPTPVPAQPQAEPADDAAGLTTVTSPIVGTYYESPSPGAPLFVKAGDQVEVGQVLCIVEAMKLMNEIEAEVAGEVVRKLVTNGQPVEYGQPLLLVRPRA